VTTIASMTDLAAATHELASDLADQRIVWLDGRHLPQTIALSPAAALRAELAAERHR
jgi:hypothetical protein